MTRRLERDLQIQCRDYLNLVHPDLLWWMVPNGGFALTPRAASLMKAMGLRAGVCDLGMILPPNGRYAAIELKALGSYPTAGQRAFIARAEAAGALCAVVRSLDSLAETLASWGIVGARGRIAA